MTTTSNRSKSKTHDRHASASTRRGDRPTASSTQGTASSPDELRETVKDAVGKGVAAVAGAVEGIDETMQETQLGDTAESAIRQVGQTATKVVRAAKEETSNIKEAFTGDASSGSGSSGLSEEDEFQTELDDPTFRGGSGGPLSDPFGSTEASSSGSPLGPGLDEATEGGSRRTSRRDRDDPIGL